MTRKYLSAKNITLACLVAVGLSYLALTPPANAAVSGWRAGNIMSDAVMSNHSTMSVSQIQSFLNSKVTCDTNGAKTSELGGGTRAQYGAANGFSSPFICLKDYYESPSSTYTVKYSYKNKSGATKSKTYTYTSNNYYKITGFTVTYNGGNYKKGIAKVKPKYTNVNKKKPSGAKSAAQLIYDTAKEFKINPQVLIVLLQKEQSLITDEWPAPVQFYSATGYGCPDTAPCDPTYANFYNQVRAAGRMFRAILNNSSTWYTPYVLGKNYIQYNPASSCGGSNVTIENRATQALYNYTPYQPNKAALNAGWGTAPCGAYGNRNFYLYFKSWFGNPTSSWTAWGKQSGSNWSTTAAPQLAFGSKGSFVLTALTQDGVLKMKKGTFGGAWGNWGTHTGGAKWAQATTGFNEASKRPRVFAVDKTGDMYYRYQKADGSWTAWGKQSGSNWSTTAAPHLAFGENGSFALTALTKDGVLKMKKGTFGGAWGNWGTHTGGAKWAQATTGFNEASKRPRVFAVDKTGDMYYRYQFK